jgi:hypothetical protein
VYVAAWWGCRQLEQQYMEVYSQLEAALAGERRRRWGAERQADALHRERTGQCRPVRWKTVVATLFDVVERGNAEKKSKQS